MSNNMNNSSSYMPVGTTLQSGKYRIESHLASGGFGNTYKAKNIYFDEIVAIKEFYMKGVTHRDAETQNVSVSNSDNEPLYIEQKQKFLKEAKRIYKLSKQACGNIVDVKDFFEENGTAYYVMGYIEGKSLSKKVKEAEPHFRLPQREVFGYMMQILDALEVVHDKNLFHLDLKPANVMVDKDGKAILIDFGASKQTNQDGGEATRTALCYTPGYAPLEQIEQDLDNIGTWTDLYSLGATLFYTLTGLTPPKPTKLLQEGDDALHFPDDIVAGMRELVSKLMKPNRKNRFQTVDEVRQWISKNIKKPERLPDAIKVADDSEDSGETVVITEDFLKKKAAQEKKEREEREKQERAAKLKAEKAEQERKEREEKERRERIAQEQREKAEQIRREQEKRKQEEQLKSLKSEPVNVNVAEETGGKKPLPVKTIAMIGAALVVLVLGVVGVSKCGSSDEEVTPVETPATPAVVSEAQPATVKDMKATNSLGDYLYTGPVDANSLPHGTGEAVFTNSNTAKSYRGPFVHGVMQGADAEYLFQNGDTFSGSFKDGHFEEGKLTISQTGESYVGKFDENGVPPADENGNPTAGTWYDKDGNKI